VRVAARALSAAGVGNAEGLSAGSSSLLGSARETTAFAGILPFFSNAFRAQRVNLKANIARGERIIGSRIQTPKQANKQAIAFRQQTILLLLIFCNVIDLFAPMRRPLSFRENLPCPLAL